MAGRKLRYVLAFVWPKISSESGTFGFIVRFCPQWMRQCVKRFYRGLLAVSNPLPSIERDATPWERSKPILSVIIPCHNYGRYVREAVQSLGAQTFRDFETILVDDGSDDAFTLKTIDALEREGILVLRQKKLNVAAALNHGISVARGRYICCFAADDKFEPTYFEKCLCLLESNPGVDFAYPIARTFGFENKIWLTEPFDLGVLLGYNHICATAIFKRAMWEEVGGFDTTLDGYEDWDFWIRAGRAGSRGRLIREILFNYRRHRAALSLRADSRSRELIRHIHSTNAELFANPEMVAEIRKSYRDIRAHPPFLNLNSRTQYLGSREQQIVLIASSTADAKAIMCAVQSSGINPILVTTNNASYRDTIRQANTFVNSYALSLFLDPYCWLDFILNLIETRSPSMVLVSTEMAYRWVPIMKAHTSVPVVDIVRDATKGGTLSAKYDLFIDFHAVTSTKAAKWLTEQFGLSEAKICLLSDSNLHDAITDLLQSLMKRDAAT